MKCCWIPLKLLLFALVISISSEADIALNVKDWIIWINWKFILKFHYVIYKYLSTHPAIHLYQCFSTFLVPRTPSQKYLVNFYLTQQTILNIESQKHDHKLGKENSALRLILEVTKRNICTLCVEIRERPRSDLFPNLKSRVADTPGGPWTIG
jgi:hypothetical protein